MSAPSHRGSPAPRRVLATALVLLAAACGSRPVGPPPHVGTRHDKWDNRIDDEETWQHLAARPASQTTSRTEVVKFLIDLEDGRKAYFLDTELYDIHYFFARDFLDTPEHPVEGHAAFNAREYRHEDRRFVCGTIAHYLDPDIWTLELIAGDNLSGERIVRAYEQLKGLLYFGEHLRFRPISELHERSIAAVRDRLNVVTTAEVFSSVRYQPLTLGEAFGTLRIVRGEVDQSTVRPDQVLLLTQVPDDLPVSAGVITAQMQAPLGHLAILCATRGTPNMALRDAQDVSELTEMEGQLVALNVGPQDYSIRPATHEEAEQAWAARRPAEPLVPVMSLQQSDLVNACELRLDDVVFAGAKASQVGELCGMGGDVVVPPGFVIPFKHYIYHVQRSGIAASLGGMLADEAFRTDSEARGRALADLRTAIERAPVDPGLMHAIRAHLANLPGDRVIMRSSTNAEDLPGFTGAGLYRSIIVAKDGTDEQLATALRQVWSSLWLQVAFEERDWYRIDHTRTAMAVLVQSFVGGAAANGVAITANPFYEGRPGVLINAQHADGSVTGAGGDEIPEQHLVYTYNAEPEPEVLSRSSLDGGRPVMHLNEVVALTRILQRIHEHFVPLWEGRANAADVEFLVAGPDRHIVILQARPFSVVYTEGRRWER